MIFQLIPYAGATPLKFAMTPTEVKAALGAPTRIGSNWRKDITYEYDEHDLCVGFAKSDMRIDHLGFGHKAQLFYEGVDLFRDPEAFGRLLALEDSPYESVGFIFLLSLGVQLEGFHEASEYGKTISLFPRGSRDGLRLKFKRFDPANWRNL